MATSRRVGNYSTSAKAVIRNSDAIFDAAMSGKPDFTKISKEAIKGRSLERRAVTKAEAEVANAGIKAQVNVRKADIKGDALIEKGKLAGQQYRKAGVLAGLGGIATGFVMKSDKAAAAKERAEREARDAKQDERWAALLSRPTPKFEFDEKPPEAPGTDKPLPERPAGSIEPTGGGTTVPTSTSGSGGTKPSAAPPASSVKPGAILTKAQLATYARNAGFPESEISTAVAVAMGESGGKIDAYNGKGNDDSYGLMQINMIDKPGYQLGTERRGKFGLKSNSELNDPQTNMNAAYQIWKGSGWKAWGAYTNGSYQNHL